LSVDTESEYPKIPTLCPVCGQPLEEDGVNLVCSNENCPNVERSRLITWLEVIGVRDMLGVGSALLNAIIQELEYYYNRKNINIFDLYAENSILYNDEYKTKMLNTFTPSAKEKTEQIFNNLVQSVTVSKVLIALNIYGLGKLTCEKISDNIYAWFVNNDYSEIEKISEIENIGDFVKTTVIKHLNLIGRILSTQKIENVRKDENFGSIAKIAITGALSIPRKQFELICKQHNVEISTNIKQCNFVVTNDSTGNSSKLIKARQYGIPTITEKEFTEKYLCG